MRSMLLAAAGSLAVACLAAAPAQAQQTFARGFAPPSARTADSQFSTRIAFGRDGRFDGRFGGCFGDGRRTFFSDDGGHDGHGHGHGGGHGDGHGDGHHRHDRAVFCDGGYMDYYGGEWALYNNRSWESDSYNDWWHDRPDRSMPRWVTHNEGCARMWYAGDTLRC